jgi:transcriptional regulator with XRE-family HTH domain
MEEIAQVASSTIKIRTGALDQLRATLGNSSDYALALRIGVAPSTVSRLRSGFARPGVTAIAGLLNAFPNNRFEDLFVVESEGQP